MMPLVRCRRRARKDTRMRSALGVIVFVISAPLSAQWLNYPTPGIPRLPDGKPNLTAPAPRSADGKLLNGVEGRVAGEEGYGRVQSPAGKQHQRETGPGLLIVDANGAFIIELAGSSFARLLSKCARQGGRCRGRG